LETVDAHDLVDVPLATVIATRTATVIQACVVFNETIRNWPISVGEAAEATKRA
jgi:hypothetical protein